MSELITISEPNESPAPQCNECVENTQTDKKTITPKDIYRLTLEKMERVDQIALENGPGNSTQSRVNHNRAMKRFEKISSEIVAKEMEQLKDKENVGENLKNAMEAVRRKSSWADVISEETLNKPREENEINFINELRSILNDLNHPHPEILDQSEHIRSCIDSNSSLQRMQINRMLAMLCQDHASETRTDRYMLSNVGDPQVWLNSLKTVVIPRLMALQLI